MKNTVDVITHYDLLIDEDNDPVQDPPTMQEYMNSWDGMTFFKSLNLTKDKTVLEIGVGTGRLALKVAPPVPKICRGRHFAQNSRSCTQQSSKVRKRNDHLR